MKESITLIVMYEGPFWVGIFERQTQSGYSVARIVFGSEPTDPEVYDYLLNLNEDLVFTEPEESDGRYAQKKVSPKRQLREAKKLNASGINVSKAQRAIGLELEKNKKEKKEKRTKEREEELQRKFMLKQQKKKEKHKGH